jgi:hypothetical protein
MKQAGGLSPRSGMNVFEIVYRLLQETPNTDKVALSWRLAVDMGYDIPERTFRHGLRQLLEREFLYESLVDGVYFVNITYMFNGDRLAFVNGYAVRKPNYKPKPMMKALTLPVAEDSGCKSCIRHCCRCRRGKDWPRKKPGRAFEGAIDRPSSAPDTQPCYQMRRKRGKRH